MGESFFDYADIFKRPSIIETVVDILLSVVPIWLAITIGILIGWSWRPKWTGLLFLGLRSRVKIVLASPPGLGARRLWLALTALSAFSICRTLWCNLNRKNSSLIVVSNTDDLAAGSAQVDFVDGVGDSTTDNAEPNESADVTENDLEHLLHLIEGKDVQAEWQCLMERTISNMSYQAWRNEPQDGPTIYRSKTVFDDVAPELVRDFFWDDEFRARWDPMLAYFKILKECPHTGTTIVQWIKKFPFFCSDREYVIGRRIWEAGRTYYCVTKGVPYAGLPKRERPRRVELYFSSWAIKAAESRKGDGQLSACEVVLFHYEDMGIPKDVAKLGVRHAMWGAVKKLNSGIRAYQKTRKTCPPLSQNSLTVHITAVPSQAPGDSIGPVDEDSCEQSTDSQNRVWKGLDWKWVVLGGVVAVALGLSSGVVGKLVLVTAGRKITRRC